jgi:TPR repeat protein
LYFKKAAENGHSEGQFHYGVCLRDGKGVSQSHEKAFEFFNRAAEGGVAEAEIEVAIAIAFECGRGVAQSHSKAGRVFKISADKGSFQGQFHHGLCLREGKGAPRDLSSAMDDMKLAADGGLEGAQFVLLKLGKEFRRTNRKRLGTPNWWLTKATLNRSQSSDRCLVLVLDAKEISKWHSDT